MQKAAGLQKASGIYWPQTLVAGKQSKTESRSASLPLNSLSDMTPSDFGKSHPLDDDQQASGFNIFQKVFINKSSAIPTLKILLEFIIAKIKTGNPEQLILACKVYILLILILFN